MTLAKSSAESNRRQMARRMSISLVGQRHVDGAVGGEGELGVAPLRRAAAGAVGHAGALLRLGPGEPAHVEAAVAVGVVNDRDGVVAARKRVETHVDGAVADRGGRATEG